MGFLRGSEGGSMTNDYLKKEYELCFAQLRFYDERHSNILQYLFTLTSAVATAQFAVYKLSQGVTKGFFICQTFLSIVVFVATVLLFLAMLQNRLYFVIIARQINAIRGYLMETEAAEFRNNQLYTSTDFPALKNFSVHTFQLLGAAFLSSLFAGAAAYGLYPAFGHEPSICSSVITFFVVLIVEIGVGAKHLSSSKGKSADEVIHGERKKLESGKI
jgi:hypothetical protein